MTPRLLGILICAMAFTCLTGTNSAAENDPVEVGQEALQDAGNFPWYDEETDSVRSIEFKPVEKPNSLGKWTWDIPDKKPRSRGNMQAFWEAFWSVVQVLIWGGLAVLVAVAIFYGVRSSSLSEARLSSTPSEIDIEDQAKRIENLPFQVDKPLSDLLAEARRLYDAGRYGDAIVYLFSHQLVQLDKHQMIRLAKGKTNRQYLRELRTRRGMRDLMTETMVAFEDFFFGNHAIERSRFESCWARLDEFNQGLEQSGGAS